MIACCACFAANARAERIPRVELLKVIEVAGTRISLSDLLPPAAPQDLRVRAENISLGSSPQPGNTRVLEASAIQRTASGDPELLSQVIVPARMIVSRGARPITLGEVFTVIRGALRQSGFAAAETLRPQDVLFQSQVFVSPGDSGLEVMRMDVDQGLNRARFLLWPARDPNIVPFLVTARLTGDLSALSSARAAGSASLVSQNSVPKDLPASSPDILVARGERATVLVHSDTLRMFVDVIPLERGALGQQIQVRTVDGGKVFRAQVDGPEHLEVKF